MIRNLRALFWAVNAIMGLRLNKPSNAVLTADLMLQEFDKRWSYSDNDEMWWVEKK